MEKKIGLFCTSILVAFFLALQITLAQPAICDWRGYAQRNTTSLSNANTSHVVTSYTNGALATNGTLYSDGYYILHVTGTSGDNITLQICGVNVTQGTQTWSCSDPGYHILNISINTSANSAACTYACGCTGGYCNSGVCASSAPTTTTTATTTTIGGGGGGAAATTTTVIGTTTTTLPPVVESETVQSIPNGTTGNFSFEKVPVTEVLIDVNKTVSNAQVTITQSSTSPADITISAPGYTYAYLTVTKTNVADAAVSKVKIRFKVEKSWISANNIDASTISLNRYVSGSWVTLTTAKLSEDATYVYFEAESPGLSVFAVSGQKKAVITTTTTTVPSTTTTTPSALPVVPTQTWLIIIGVLTLIAVVIYFAWITRKPAKVHTTH